MSPKALIAIAALALAAACSPAAPKKAEPTPAPASTSACRDDGPKLPGTGICTISAANYFDPETLAAAPIDAAPRDCTWEINETLMAGDEAILYRALRCKGVTAQLAFAGGAHSASLTLKTSALGVPTGAELVRVFTTDPADPQGAIRALIAEAPAKQRSRCEVQPAAIEGWPKDALVITFKAAFAGALSRDEPDAVCGPYGLDEDSMTFWRLHQGYAWFFTLGQDAFEIDPGSITLLRKGADGGWGAVE